MESLILSPYTFLFEDNNNFYVFNAESLFFSKITETAYESLYNHDFAPFDAASINIFLEKRILIKESEKDTCYNHALTKHLTSAYSDDTMSLIVAPTTACNFACPYCFEPKKNPKFMSQEVEWKLIDYINKQDNIKNISLTWYGGEPLLAFESIKRIFNNIKNETDKKIVHHEIISNTYLVNDEVIEFMNEAKVGRIQVSLDGLKSSHNKTRFLKSSKEGTYDRIIENIKKMAIALPETFISIRVNVDKNNWEEFVTLYHYYHGEEWHKNIGLYPGFIRENTVDGRCLKHHCYRTDEILDLYFKWYELGVNIQPFPGSRFKGCMLQRANSFIIGPEGELYKCWDDVSNPDRVVGSIMDNDLHNYPLLLKYMQECRPIREECKECTVFPVCDGGCGRQQYRNKFENGSFELCGPLKNKENLKKALLHSVKALKETQFERKILKL